MSPVDSRTAHNFTHDSDPNAFASIQQSAQGVAKMLAELAEASPKHMQIERTCEDSKYENRLAVVRLGMATSLFSALRAKHPPSASHSLRVALLCAAWSERLRFSQNERERLEVAALLHDVGKIGIPDRILRKPGKLTVEEQLTVSLCPKLGIEILSGCCNDPQILEIVQYGTAWYSGRHDQERRGDELPIGARMLAIADAFDAMTTDHVYRPALSRETAIRQLIECSGTQFDPELTHDYCSMMKLSPDENHRRVLRGWMNSQNEIANDTRWGIQSEPKLEHACDILQDESLRFHDQLLDNMSDGVIYIDRDGVVRNWNKAAEQLSGVAASAAVQMSWAPSLLGLSDDEGTIDAEHCPVHQAIATSAPFMGRYVIQRQDGTSVPVRINTIPVQSDQPGLSGVVVIAHDGSHQRHLEERVKSLHRQANHDPLTKVANRAAFDRRLAELTTRRLETGASFSLIICDIDHFKRVNDVHGHQAGDEALVKFAGVLSTLSRDGDLVSRYGGEEFVILSPDCDIATATERAESIRKVVEQTQLPSIGNQAITASFGVTEVQAGDSSDSVVARADRALLQAKDSGRNQVIQLGGGAASAADTKKPIGRFGWLFKPEPEHDKATSEIITPVPANFAIEKLRGFIADHKAEIVSVSEGNLHLRVNARFGLGGRRNADSLIPFNVYLKLVESHEPANPQSRRPASVSTKVKIELSPVKTRDRRRQEVETCSNQVVLALKSYLMGRFESS